MAVEGDTIQKLLRGTAMGEVIAFDHIHLISRDPRAAESVSPSMK